MSTLSEIEAAATSLPPEQKQELLLFLVSRLRSEGAQLPLPRQLSREEIASWIADDEADLGAFPRWVVRLFLDTSVLLSACGSEKGASREIFRLASAKNWTLVATPYVIQEVSKNLQKLGDEASGTWAQLQIGLVILEDVVTLDRPVMFGAKARTVRFFLVHWHGRTCC